MIALLRFHLLQVWRSRVLVFWFFFAVFIQYTVINLLHALIVRYNEVETLLGPSQVAIGLLYAQFFSGGILALIFGVWVIPYFHEEGRAPLTFTLPISRGAFAAVYSLGFAGLLLLQTLVSVITLIWRYGWQTPLPWVELLSGNVLLLVNLQTLAFLFALLVLFFGKTTGFLGGIFLTCTLMVSGWCFWAGLGKGSWWAAVYPILPPIGDVLIDVQMGPVWKGVQGIHALVALGWWLTLAAAFSFRLRRVP